MNIPTWPQADEREAEMLRMVLDSPHWGGFHPFVGEFERSFAAYQHTLHGISAFNGTVTLELALTILGIGPGDEVIVPAISFISSATAISRVGAVPVFVDLEPRTFHIDPEQARKAISPATRAVMAVHFGGMMCNMDELTAICRERALHLIEDAAHAQGAEWKGRRAGAFGIAGSFSFQNGKVLTAGEGGLLVTSDNRFAEEARSLANCGRTPGRSFYDHARLGTNFRMSAFQAAILLVQLERLPEQIATRTANVRRLKQALADLAAIEWQEQPDAVGQNPWYLMIGRARGGEPVRNELCRALKAAGVPCTPFYPHPLYANELYSEGRAKCRVLPCPSAEDRVRDSFWLPHRVLLADEATIQEVAAIMRQALVGSSALTATNHPS
jgi:dTDP-4-amino-4,6-dideoxygalactose transaminase